VEEGRVAEETERAFTSRAGDARGQCEAGPHAEQRVADLQWRCHAERVAADVVEVERLVTEHRARHEERRAMRARWAERGLPLLGQLMLDLDRRGSADSQRLVQGVLDDLRAILVPIGEMPRALAQDASGEGVEGSECANAILDVGRQLLDHEQGVHLAQLRQQELLGKGIDDAQLDQGDLILHLEVA